MSGVRRRLAAWLLERCCHDTRGSALVGDILEECASGRSAIWVWKEVGSAIAMTLGREVRRHPFRALEAAAIGMIVLPVFQYGAAAIAPDGVPAARAFAAAFVTAWVIGRLVRAPIVVSVGVFAASYVAITTSWVTTTFVALPSDESPDYLARQAAAIATTAGGLVMAGLALTRLAGRTHERTST